MSRRLVLSLAAVGLTTAGVVGCKTRSKSDLKSLAYIQDHRIKPLTVPPLIMSVHTGIVIEVRFDNQRIWLCDQNKDQVSKLGQLDTPKTKEILQFFAIDAATLKVTPRDQATCVDRGTLMEQVSIAVETWLDGLRLMGEAGEVPIIAGSGPQGKAHIPKAVIYSADLGDEVPSSGDGAQQEVFVYDPSAASKVIRQKRSELSPTSMAVSFNYEVGRPVTELKDPYYVVNMTGKLAEAPSSGNSGDVLTKAVYRTPFLQVHDIFYMRGQLLHEFGHVLGLSDTNYMVDGSISTPVAGDTDSTYGDQPYSLMNNGPRITSKLTRDDKGGLAWLYGYFVAKTLSDPAACPNNFRHDAVTNGCLWDETAQDHVKSENCVSRFGVYDRGACFCPLRGNTVMEIGGTELCAEDTDMKILTLDQFDTTIFKFRSVACRHPGANRYFIIKEMRLIITTRTKTASFSIKTDAARGSPYVEFQKAKTISEVKDIVSSIKLNGGNNVENHVQIINANFGPESGGAQPPFSECKVIIGDNYNNGVLTQ